MLRLQLIAVILLVVLANILGQLMSVNAIIVEV
jgi:hypothetical protein